MRTKPLELHETMSEFSALIPTDRAGEWRIRETVFHIPRPKGMKNTCSGRKSRVFPRMFPQGRCKCGKELVQIRCHIVPGRPETVQSRLGAVRKRVERGKKVFPNFRRFIQENCWLIRKNEKNENFFDRNCFSLNCGKNPLIDILRYTMAPRSFASRGVLML